MDSRSTRSEAALPPLGGLLLDIDGTLHEAGRPVEGAAKAVAELRHRVPLLFTTNTSRMPRRAVAEGLRRMGIEAGEEEVLSAAVAAALHLRAAGIGKLQLLAPAAVREDFAGFEITDSEPEAVVVTDMGSGFTFEVLNSAFRSLLAGARLVAAHRNRYWMTADGPTLDAGAFVAALEMAAGTEAELVGKPAPAFFERAAERLGCVREDLAVVGDDPETDVEGARRAGLIAIQVRTGKSRPGGSSDMGTKEPDSDSASRHIWIESIAELPALFSRGIG